jgi:hypothetical protein
MFIVKSGTYYFGPFTSASEASDWIVARQQREWPNLPLEFSVIQLQGATT